MAASAAPCVEAGDRDRGSAPVGGGADDAGRHGSAMKKTGKDSLVSWLVCASCFWTTLCFFPFHRTANVIFPVLTRQYGFSRKIAFDMFGTLIVTSCASGIIVSYLMRYVSSRKIIIAAHLAAAIGLAQLYLDITKHGILILGALYGIGRGTLNNQFPVILSSHFDKHRTKAVGSQRAGICLTGFAFAAAIPALIEAFGLQACFLMLAGIMLAGLLGVIFLAPPDEPAVDADKQKELVSLIGRVDKNETQPQQASDSHSDINVKNHMNNNRDAKALSISQMSVHRIPHHDDLNRRVSVRSRRSSIASSVLEAAATPMDGFVLVEAHTTAHDANPNDQLDVPLNGGHLPSPPKQENPGLKALFRNLMLYPLLMSMFSLYLHFNVYALLIDIAQDKGVSAHDAPILNMIFSVTEFTAYLTVGFITKDKRTRTRNLQLVSQVTCCSIPLLYSISSTFLHFAVLTAVSAYTSGTMLLLNVILARQLLGDALFARGLGVLHITGIFSYFFISPLIGFYRDVYGSYVPFLRIISGVTICFVPFWLLEIPYLRQQKRLNQTDKAPITPT